MKLFFAGLTLFLSGTFLFAALVSAEAKSENQISSQAAWASQPSPENSTEDVKRTERELQHMLAANQKLRQEYEERMRQVEQITAQAKVHQRILNQLKTQISPGASVTEQALRQEKIRLIAEQTRKNQELLSSLESPKQKRQSS
ncbi:MAG: hypothetical protein HY586_05845 [Candidatus Omnitrophica bacterium]|nr:hypothetical protein [Candidatus Omnitrophota bacterium]